MNRFLLFEVSRVILRMQPVSEEHHSGEDFGYVVAFRRAGSSTWIQTVLASPDASRYIYKDDRIEPLTLFEVKVGAYNSIGEGQFSRVVRVFSAEEGKSHKHSNSKKVLSLSFADILHVITFDQSYLEPSEAPLSIWARAVSATEIEVHWKPIPSGSSRGKILAYEVGNDNYDIIALQYRFRRIC